jgi:hypothetical protein
VGVCQVSGAAMRAHLDELGEVGQPDLVVAALIVQARARRAAVTIVVAVVAVRASGLTPRYDVLGAFHLGPSRPTVQVFSPHHCGGGHTHQHTHTHVVRGGAAPTTAASKAARGANRAGVPRACDTACGGAHSLVSSVSVPAST